MSDQRFGKSSFHQIAKLPKNVKEDKASKIFKPERIIASRGTTIELNDDKIESQVCSTSHDFDHATNRLITFPILESILQEEIVDPGEIFSPIDEVYGDYYTAIWSNMFLKKIDGQSYLVIPMSEFGRNAWHPPLGGKGTENFIQDLGRFAATSLRATIKDDERRADIEEYLVSQIPTIDAATYLRRFLDKDLSDMHEHGRVSPELSNVIKYFKDNFGEYGDIKNLLKAVEFIS